MSHSKDAPEALKKVTQYGAYQNEVYAAGMLNNIKPTITKDPNKLEEQARKQMSAPSYSYVAGAAGERATLDANRLAFRQWKVRHSSSTLDQQPPENPPVDNVDNRSSHACSGRLPTSHSLLTYLANITRTL